MNRFAAGIVALGVAFASVSSVAMASADAPNTAPITVTVHTYTKAYTAIMARCMGRDDSFESYRRCAKQHPDNGDRCTRVEVWLADNSHTVVRDEC